MEKFTPTQTVQDGSSAVSEDFERDKERRQVLFRQADVLRRYHGYRSSWFMFLNAISAVFCMIGPLVAICLMSVDGHKASIAAGCVMFSVAFIYVLNSVLRPERKASTHRDLRNAYIRLCTQSHVHPMRVLSYAEWEQIEKDLCEACYKNDDTILHVLMARAENDFCDANGSARPHRLRWWNNLTIQTNLFSDAVASVRSFER